MNTCQMVTANLQPIILYVQLSLFLLIDPDFHLLFNV